MKLCKNCIHCVLSDSEFLTIKKKFEYARCNLLLDCMGEPKEYCSTARERGHCIEAKHFKPKPPDPKVKTLDEDLKYVYVKRTLENIEHEKKSNRRWYEFFKR